MTQPRGFEDKVAFVWGVADLLRGDFKAHEYGQVVLPLLVVRRLECALAATKEQVLAQAGRLPDGAGRDAVLKQVAGHRFYNTSRLDLERVLADPSSVAANLRTYLLAFSPAAREVLQAYDLEPKIERLDKAGLLYQVLSRFAEIDLSETAVSNEAMGYVFEELLRKFSEMSNETAGEHFTPRDVIRLMVSVLFSVDDDVLRGRAPVRTLYDPACGTGGMLTMARDHLRELNPDAELRVYGQELNSETWAVCRSDLMIQDQDPERIALGNSLTEDDAHEGVPFDYLLANPPFGVDWKKYRDSITNEHQQLGDEGRYGAGLPRVDDGALLFLQHMLSKTKPPTTADDGSLTGGTRLAIVFSGSPLFAGAAGGGESSIRQWILENDWLEGIVALPDQLFYNTGIGTYFWVLSNRKPAERRGKVVLVDARESFAKMRRSLGDKRKHLPDDAVEEVTALYAEALERVGEDKRVRVCEREEFGFQRITVERPLRRVWRLTEEAVDALRWSKAWERWVEPPKKHDDPQAHVQAVEQAQEQLLARLREHLSDEPEATEADMRRRLQPLLDGLEVDVPDKVRAELLDACAVHDEDAPVITDAKGRRKPDPDLRDKENVPLPAGWLSLDQRERGKALVEAADAHLEAEVQPWAPGAWLDHTKTKVGFEIPFTRHFYEYVPPRPLAEIDAEIRELSGHLIDLLRVAGIGR